MSTFTPIATQTLGSAVASVVFSSIPQNYTDLFVSISSKGSLDAVACQYNGDTSASYSYNRLYGNDLNVVSPDYLTGISSAPFGFASPESTNINTYQIFNYASGAHNKAGLGRSGINDYGGYVFAYVNRWANNSPINSILFRKYGGGNFSVGDTFTLYGIAAGNTSSKATGGNVVVSDGSYWYHAFTSSGSFVPDEGLSADVLLVAGGGGGGNGGGAGGGGGGAGGVRAFTSQSFSGNTYYPVIVGAGGAGAWRYQVINSNGTNSSVAGLSATGGGRGGSYVIDGQGVSGGSGGGTTDNGSARAGGTGNAGSYTPVEGYAGGSTPGMGIPNGSGGGGASAAGGAASSGSGGAGGAGTDTYNSINFSTWLTAVKMGESTKVGGGGGGASYLGATAGSGGVGGGGNGETRGSGGVTPGKPNTGGGGGGTAIDVSGQQDGNGGSGLVVIRYAV